MGYYLRRPLTNYRFNHQYYEGPINVSWFFYDEESGDGRLFTDDELKIFINFTLQHPDNFGEGSDYHTVNDEEDDPAPSCSFYLELGQLKHPENLILKPKPKLSKNGTISSCMEIILATSRHEDQHKYGLNFNVIGRIDI